MDAMDGPPQPPARQRLEIPEQTSLERRLLVDGAAAAAPRAKPSITAPPTSALLGRLQTFLPALQASNASLGEAPQEVGVLLEPAGGSEEEEGAEDEEGGASGGAAGGAALPEGEQYIQMDLACGLFDLKDDAAVAAAERSLTLHDVAIEQFGQGGSSDSDSDSSSGSDDDGGGGEGGGAAPGEAGALPQQCGAAGEGPARRGKRGRRKPMAGIEELT